jgi:integrase
MGRVYKVGKKYYGDWRDHTGVRHRESLDTTSKRVADQELGERELASRRPRPDPLTVAQVLTLALEEKARKARAKKRNPELTLKGGRIHAGHLERILGKDLDFNDPETNLRRVGEYYFDQRGEEQTPWHTPITPHTRLKELGTLRQGLAKAQDYELFFRKPGLVIPDALRNGDVYVPRDRWLTEQEYAAIWAVATEHRRPWLDFMVETGADLGEMHKIVKVDHLDFSTQRGPFGAVNVPGTKAASRNRFVPLTQKARAAVDLRMREPGAKLFEPLWTSSNFKRSTKRWEKLTGVPAFVAKDLRRTFASRCCQLSIPEMHVAQLLGHVDSKLVRRVYGRLSVDTFDAAISKLNAVPYLCHDNVVSIDKHRENVGTQKDQEWQNA